MAEYEFVTVDVFTDRRFGGNPLAVFPDARGLTAEQMQALAAEFNLSETTFVLPPRDASHTAEVRIFTPKGELPFAGHPNIGTGFVLARRAAGQMNSLAFEEKAGLVAIRVARDAEGRVRGTELDAPQPLSTGAEIPADIVAACAGLRTEDIAVQAHRPLVASVGTDFVVAEVASVAALSRAAPDLSAFRHAAARFPGVATRFSLHLYAHEAPGRLRARMFAPLGGIIEDPATGSANVALAALLASLRPGDTSFAAEIAQGVEMGRPSTLRVSARRTPDGVRASVAGDCVPVMRGYAEI